MLITFKSDSSADVIMFGDSAKKLLAVIGKGADDAKGIVTLEQLPQAISRLRAAIEEDRTNQVRQSDADQDEAREKGETGMAAPVGFAQRAWPLLDVLERAQRDGVPVTWGV